MNFASPTSRLEKWKICDEATLANFSANSLPWTAGRPSDYPGGLGFPTADRCATATLTDKALRTSHHYTHMSSHAAPFVFVSPHDSAGPHSHRFHRHAARHTPKTAFCDCGPGISNKCHSLNDSHNHSQHPHETHSHNQRGCSAGQTHIIRSPRCSTDDLDTQSVSGL